MGNLLYENLGRESVVLISLSIILLSGFIMTRLTKKLRLPNVSGFILAGLFIGPNMLNLVPEAIIQEMDFLSDIALAFIAFGVGGFFKKESMGKTGGKALVITLLEALVPGVLVTLSMRYFFRMDWSFSILLGAIGMATAPASTMMTIKQYNAKGHFIDMLLQVVALDDVVALLAFGIASAFIQAGVGGGTFAAVMRPVLNNFIGIAAGAMLGFLLKKLMNDKRSNDNRLIIPLAMLLGLSGVCNVLEVSPLLGSMVFGAVYVNISGDRQVFDQVDGFSPPILSCFFILSGMRLDSGALATCGVIGVAYFFIRIVGKYAGAYMGARLTKESPEIRRYLGLALVPQAGVSIGLAFLGRRILPEGIGEMLSNIILASSFLYELVGPACGKLALVLAGTIEEPQESDKAEIETIDAEEILI